MCSTRNRVVQLSRYTQIACNEGKQNLKVKNKNITRDIEIKNNVTIARGAWGGDSGERGLQELL